MIRPSMLWLSAVRPHEQGFVYHLAEQGGTATIHAGVGIDQASVTQTRHAMESGDAVTVRAALRDGHLSGRADVLRRVGFPRPVARAS